MSEDSIQRSNKRKAEFKSCEEEEFSEVFLENPEKHSEGDTVNSRIKALEKAVLGRFGIEQRLEQLEAQLADLTNDYCVLQRDNRDLSIRNEFLESVIVKQDKEIHELKKAQTDIVSRSMRNNIMLHNIKESPKEDAESVVRRFLKARRILTEDEVQRLRFDRVHRTGTSVRGRARPIVARLTFYQDKEKIIRNWNSTGQKDRKQPRVTQQVPTEILAKRAQNHHLIEEMKAASTDKNEQLKVSIKGENLYINQQRINPKVMKPTMLDVLSTDKDDLAKARKLPHAISPVLQEAGSMFQAQAVRTKTIPEVRLAYRKLLTCPDAARASHNVLAYKIRGELGWEDDGEHGAGRFLAHWLSSKEDVDNISIFLTRHYGGERLGAKRFELMRESAKLACEDLAEQLHLE